MERHVARIGSRSGGFAPTPSSPSRMTMGAAMPAHVSAAIDSCVRRVGSPTFAEGPISVTPGSTSPLLEGTPPRTSGGLRRRSASFLRISSLQSASLKASRTSIFHPHRCRHCAATKASPALCPFPAKTMHRPGLTKNFVTACATPAPALFISASTCTPLANAASSAARICAEVKIGKSNQPSRSDEPVRASESAGFDELFFLRALFLCERFERRRSDFATLV